MYIWKVEISGDTDVSCIYDLYGLADKGSEAGKLALIRAEAEIVSKRNKANRGKLYVSKITCVGHQSF